MRLRVNQVVVELDYAQADVLRAVARRLQCRPAELVSLEILRRSLDARQKDRPPHYVISAEVEFRGERTPSLLPGQIEQVAEPAPLAGLPQVQSDRPAPVVVGAGPAGLMAALRLAEAGLKPLLVERGAATQTRGRQVEAFWRDGILDAESNVLYGEGGAGLFSDGKLTARSKDRAGIRRFFQVLVECGASSDILIDAEPHIGSDVLVELIPALRKRILDLGGAVAFDSRLERIRVEAGALRGVIVGGREIRTDACFLAVGHSARDVYEMLAEEGVPLEAKPSAIGVRLEIPQARIDTAQYGKWAGHPRLGSASFRLTRKGDSRVRSCYSFCMCPGGLVIASASSPGLLTTNGMSFSKRDTPFGNAAFLAPVSPEDFPAVERHPALAGVEFQRRLEQAAFEAGGRNFGLPAERLVDFLEGKDPKDIPVTRSCTRAVAADLQALLPDYVADTLRAAIPGMLRELKGVVREEALLYAVETRTSSPVRILRDEGAGRSPGVKGLFPVGEGSGYAGGIVSSALDGMNAAERMVQLFHG